MDLLEWAKKEVELACNQSIDKEGGELDYSYMCYQSALKAYESLLSDNHSGFSFSLTQAFLNCLMDGRPLTPIEDTDEIWEYCYNRANGVKAYQCKRMSSLFKDVDSDGNISYHDLNRIVTYDIDSPKVGFTNHLASSIVNELYPVKMPYNPSPIPYKVYTESFVYAPDTGWDFDTIGILYFITPEGQKIEVNRFFKYDKNHIRIEISDEEYESRRKEVKERE